MNGASREALAAARESLTALTDSTPVDATTLADELAAVTTLLEREVSLRRVLTDPARDGEAKAGLVTRVLGEQVGGPAVDLVAGMVRSRWSSSRDLVDAVEELADYADLVAAGKTARWTTWRTSCSGSPGRSPPPPNCALRCPTGRRGPRRRPHCCTRCWAAGPGLPRSGW